MLKNKYISPRLEDLHQTDAIADQMEKFFYERILSDNAKATIYAECEEKFRIRDDDIISVGMWRGEFWGKWVISACRAARYEHDEKLKDFLHTAALNLIATADADGYIGTYKDKYNVFSPTPEQNMRDVGHINDWNWNVWCRKYTLWGLLEVYMLTDDKAILDATVRFADDILNVIAALKTTFRDVGTAHFRGLPPCSIMKPMLKLYEITGCVRYLDAAVKIADDWEREDGDKPNLIKNALSMRPLHEWYPDSQRWAKAYEMMSCLDGIIELYRVTGVERYLTAMENMYTILNTYEQNQVFSVGFNDIFANAAAYPNSISEPCDVIHWIRVCYELFTLTGNAKYMDSLERAYYNPFLAAAFHDGKWGSRGVRSQGCHLVATGQASMQYSHCCVNNMPRGFLNALESFVMFGEDRLIINLYSGFTCKVGGFDVTITGDYLGTGKVNVDVKSDKKFMIAFRLPSWSRQTVINGEVLTVSGCYAYLPLNIGMNRYTLAFDMTPTALLSPEPPVFPTNDFRVARFTNKPTYPIDLMLTERRHRIVRGALLLCRSKMVGNTEDEMFGSDALNFDNGLTVVPAQNDAVRNAFTVTVDGKSFPMCDYATGSNYWSEEEPKLFSIWL